MNGYVVLSTDERRVGHVVDETEAFLVVEHGHLRKTKHAVPKAFARARDDDEVVLVTVSPEIVADSPKVNGEIDVAAVEAYYGIAPIVSDDI